VKHEAPEQDCFWKNTDGMDEKEIDYCAFSLKFP